MNYTQIKNPITNRYIYVGGETYKKLLKEYDESFLLSQLIVINKAPKSPHTLQYNIFSKYNINPIAVDYGKEACIYKATKNNIEYAIRITNLYEGNYIYNLLYNIDGFIKLIEFYDLPFLPPIFNLCKNIKSTHVNIYVLEWLEKLENVLPMMTCYDKYNFLYDLILALKEAKQQFGFQHNDIYYDNIMVKNMKPILIDFSKSTTDLINDKLQYKDFVSFYKLLDYMIIPRKSILYLSTNKTKNKGIEFDILLNKLKDLI